MAQILGVDSFNRDYQTEIVVCTDCPEKLAVDLAFKLNERFCSRDTDPTWYVVKKDEYVPYVFNGY